MKKKLKKGKLVGVAGLFDEMQLRSYFLNYLFIVVGIEVLIFLVTYIGSITPSEQPFPWKLYFFMAFTVPVAFTFLLGILILAFNYFCFGDADSNQKDETLVSGNQENKSYLLKFNSLLHTTRKLPFLFIMLLVLIGAMIAYKMDVILTFVVNASERMLQYLLIAGGVLLVAGIVFGGIWLVINYKLRKKHMDYQYQYRNQVMEHLELLVMDDHTVVKKDGEVINLSEPKMIASGGSGKQKFKVLTAPPDQTQT
jgi:hypothetical protein